MAQENRQAGTEVEFPAAMIAAGYDAVIAAHEAGDPLREEAKRTFVAMLAACEDLEFLVGLANVVRKVD